MKGCMNGVFAKEEFEGVGLYGTHGARFLLEGLEDSVRSNDFATALWDGFIRAEGNCIGTIYEALSKGFYERIELREKASLGNGKRIGSLNDLQRNIFFKKNAFLISCALGVDDIEIDERGSRYNGLAEMFPVVAELRKMGKRENLLVINPWGPGLGFNPEFLYDVGGRFGELVEGR